MKTINETYPSVEANKAQNDITSVDQIPPRLEIGPDQGKVARRSFMKSLALGGASLLPARFAAADEGDNHRGIGTIANGDAAILRFLAAAEILETDLWQQYTEFADMDGPYSDALENIDDDMP